MLDKLTYRRKYTCYVCMAKFSALLDLCEHKNLHYQMESEDDIFIEEESNRNSNIKHNNSSIVKQDKLILENSVSIENKSKQNVDVNTTKAETTNKLSIVEDVPELVAELTTPNFDLISNKLAIEKSILLKEPDIGYNVTPANAVTTNENQLTSRHNDPNNCKTNLNLRRSNEKCILLKNNPTMTANEGMREISCELCYDIFTRRDELKLHMDFHKQLEKDSNVVTKEIDVGIIQENVKKSMLPASTCENNTRRKSVTIKDQSSNARNTSTNSFVKVATGMQNKTSAVNENTNSCNNVPVTFKTPSNITDDSITYYIVPSNNEDITYINDNSQNSPIDTSRETARSNRFLDRITSLTEDSQFLEQVDSCNIINFSEAGIDLAGSLVCTESDNLFPKIDKVFYSPAKTTTNIPVLMKSHPIPGIKKMSNTNNSKSFTNITKQRSALKSRVVQQPSLLRTYPGQKRIYKATDLMAFQSSVSENAVTRSDDIHAINSTSTLHPTMALKLRRIDKPKSPAFRMIVPKKLDNSDTNGELLMIVPDKVVKKLYIREPSVPKNINSNVSKTSINCNINTSSTLDSTVSLQSVKSSELLSPASLDNVVSTNINFEPPRKLVRRNVLTRAPWDKLVASKNDSTSSLKFGVFNKLFKKPVTPKYSIAGNVPWYFREFIGNTKDESALTPAIDLISSDMSKSPLTEHTDRICKNSSSSTNDETSSKVENNDMNMKSDSVTPVVSTADEDTYNIGELEKCNNYDLSPLPVISNVMSLNSKDTGKKTKKIPKSCTIIQKAPENYSNAFPNLDDIESALPVTMIMRN